MTRTTSAVTSFDGDDEFLSNFFTIPVFYAGRLYEGGSEYAYQAAKFLNPEDQLLIAQCLTPGRAKLCASKLTSIGKRRDRWDDIKLVIMEEVLRAKFGRLDMGKMLRATKPLQLIEGNTWKDHYWGICNGRGENHLGRLLMKIRDGVR